MKRIYFDRMLVAGVQYGESLFCIDALKAGTKLNMVREPHNAHDPNAIALYYGEYRIGYIPACENSSLVPFLDQGWSEVFETYIDSYCPDKHPSQQIGITIFIAPRSAEPQKD